MSPQKLPVRNPLCPDAHKGPIWWATLKLSRAVFVESKRSSCPPLLGAELRRVAGGYNDNSLGSSMVDSFSNGSARDGTLDGDTLHTARCDYNHAYTIGSSPPASPQMLFDSRTNSIDSPLLAFRSAAKALVHLAQRGYDGNQHEAGGAFDFMS